MGTFAEAGRLSFADQGKQSSVSVNIFILYAAISNGNWKTGA
jgi:hypothetical protein